MARSLSMMLGGVGLQFLRVVGLVPVVNNGLLLEDNSSFILLEDNSSILLLE